MVEVNNRFDVDQRQSGIRMMAVCLIIRERYRAGMTAVRKILFVQALPAAIVLKLLIAASY